jgi:acetyl-CoA C-acetyltransferase
MNPRTPVLVGVGTASDSAPVVDLMTQACHDAASDAGCPRLLTDVDRVNLPQGSWSLTDPARTVARRIGAANALTYRYEIGVSQQEVIDDALEAIALGLAEVVLVVGGEARGYERKAGAVPDDEESAPPDHTVTRPPDFVAPIESAAGIVWPPVQQYALIENALGVHEQLSPSAHRDEIAALWARCNAVAQHNPLAAFPSPRSAEDIATPGPRNRPLAYPYNLWHSSQWTVDQAGALLLCSAAKARDLSVPVDRWVFPRVALHCSQAVTLTARRDLHAWPAMEVLGRSAAAHLGQPLRDIRLAEIYSCFPAAVRVQQRALELDVDGTPTLTGGMSFAGGPFNNFVLQSTAALVQHLRQETDELAMVTTVSGRLSKPGLAVWSRNPPAKDGGLLMADLADEAVARTPTLPVASPDAAAGAATVVSYTVTFDADEPLRPNRTAIVADLADGLRVAATCEDADVAGKALTESLVGHSVHVDHTTFMP